MQRQDPRQQRRQLPDSIDPVRALRAGMVDGGQQVIDREKIPQAGDVAGHRAIAEADHDAAPLADLLQQFEVVHIGDRPLDQSDVHPGGNVLASTSGP